MAAVVIRIGVLNLMPEPEPYESCLWRALNRASPPVELVWIRLTGRRYTRSTRSHIESRYRWYADTVSRHRIDGLILTGAPFEHLPFDEVSLLPEIREILGDAKERHIPTLGLCWGALALAHVMLGLGKKDYAEKLFGVFECVAETVAHPFAREFERRFWCPHSRYAGFSDEEVDTAVSDNALVVLARSQRAGPVVLSTPDHSALLHAGHPEYGRMRLVDEYRRDTSRGIPNVRPPEGVDLERPMNLWRRHSQSFFGNWLDALRPSRERAER